MDDAIIAEAEQELFGSLNQDLADHFAACVEAALQAGVATLPCLDDPERQRAMAQLLVKPYLKNVDVFEIYCRRNVFSLAQYAPARVAELLRRFRALPEGAVPEPAKMPETAPEPQEEEPLPSVDIPTPEELAALEAEILELRRSGAALERERAELLVATELWAAAEALAATAADALQSALPSPDRQLARPAARLLERDPPALVAAAEAGRALLGEMAAVAPPEGGPQPMDDGIVLLGRYQKPPASLEEALQAIETNENEANALLAKLRPPPVAKRSLATPLRIRAAPPQPPSAADGSQA